MAGSPPTIFIVEDDEGVADTLRAIMEREGYYVWTAASLAEARSLVEREQFDVALIDLRLRDGSGIDVLDLLNDVQPECPGIMLTGYATLDSAAAAIRRGAYDYLIKPCNLDELRLAVKGAVGRGHVRRTLHQHRKKNLV